MTQPARRRLTREARRNQILDCAQRVIVQEGLSTLTMERLATEAQVSNPLIYKYFDTRLQVLQELLVREFQAFRRSVAQNMSVDSYREAVRSYVDINFRQFAGGNVLSILLSQPDVRQAVEEGEKSRHAPFFVNQLAKEYKIRRRLAEQIIAMASGASIAAAEHYGRYGGDRAAQIEQAVDFIFGGIEQLLGARSEGA
jgi:AcrR family transcriptional regulator